MGLNRNINDDSTLAYLFNKTRQGASDALQKAIDAINATIATIQTALANKVDKSGDTMTGDLTVDTSADASEADITAKGKAGTVYLYSAGSATGNRGIYCENASGTSKAVITIDQSNNVTLGGRATNVTGTVAIANGGTGASTAANAKANLGLGTEAQNFEVTSQTSGTQLFALRAKSLNSGGNYNNHNMALVIQESGMFLYDSTGATSPWSLSFPIAVDNGGTGATSAANARKNLGLCYAANDTMAITSSLVLHGLTNSNTTIAYFDVVVEKSMENISSISVTTMTGYMVGVSGAVDGSASNKNYTGSGYSISCTKQGTHHVRVGITKSGGYTNVNGLTPVTYFGTLTLKFT